MVPDKMKVLIAVIGLIILAAILSQISVSTGKAGDVVCSGTKYDTKYKTFEKNSEDQCLVTWANRAGTFCYTEYPGECIQNFFNQPRA